MNFCNTSKICQTRLQCERAVGCLSCTSEWQIPLASFPGRRMGGEKMSSPPTWWYGNEPRFDRKALQPHFDGHVSVHRLDLVAMETAVYFQAASERLSLLPREANSIPCMWKSWLYGYGQLVYISDIWPTVMWRVFMVPGLMMFNCNVLSMIQSYTTACILLQP